VGNRSGPVFTHGIDTIRAHQSTGQWLSLETDAAQLMGIALAFITGVRFMVPVCMGAALAPTIQRWMESKQQSR